MADNLITLMCSCLELWKPQLPGALWVWTGLYGNCFLLNKESRHADE